MGTHLRVPIEYYPMNTNLTGFRCFSKIFVSMCFGGKGQDWVMKGPAEADGQRGGY